MRETTEKNMNHMRLAQDDTIDIVSVREPMDETGGADGSRMTTNAMNSEDRVPAKNSAKIQLALGLVKLKSIM